MDHSTLFSGAFTPALSWVFSLDGAMVVGAGMSIMAGSTMLKPYISGGEKLWLTPFGAWTKGLYGNTAKGIVLGRYHGGLICDTSRNHVGIAGTTGTGKTACAFLATLLLNKTCSFLVFDQSGELFRLTSGARSMLGPCYQINPGIANSDCINLLDMIPDDGNIITNLMALLKPFFDGSAQDQKKTGGDAHWGRAGHELGAFITLQVLYGDDDSKKNLGGVLEYVSDPVACLRDMVNNPRHPECARAARIPLASGERYLSSVMSTITTALSLFRDASIKRITRYSSFHVEELVTGDRPVTIYLTAPSLKLPHMLPLYVGIEEVMKLHLMDNVPCTMSGNPRKRPVIIADDEAQNTKRPSLDSLNVARKFDIRFFFGYQSNAAMMSLYGDKLGLIRTKVSFRPETGDADVENVSKLSGEYKKKIYSHSHDDSSGSRGNRRSRSTTVRIEDTPRLTKLELAEWPEFGNALLTRFGSRPAILSTFDSEKDPEFSKLIRPPLPMDTTTIRKSPWTGVKRAIVRPHGQAVPSQPAPLSIQHNEEGEDMMTAADGEQEDDIRVSF